MHHFWAQNGPFAPKQIFFWKIINIIQILKTFFQRIPSYEGVQFWAQNGPFPEMIIFSENLLMSIVPFIHAYIQAKNQSQILIY